MQSSQILEILTMITYSHVDVSCSELTRVRTAQQSFTFVISIWSIFLIYILTNSYIIKNFYILMTTVMKVGIEALKEMIEVDNIWSTKRRGEWRWLSLDSWHVHWNYNVQLCHSSVTHNTVSDYSVVRLQLSTLVDLLQIVKVFVNLWDHNLALLCNFQITYLVWINPFAPEILPKNTFWSSFLVTVVL